MVFILCSLKHLKTHFWVYVFHFSIYEIFSFATHINFAFQGCMMILFHFKMFLFFLLKLGRHQELRCSNYYMCSWTLIYTKFLFLFSTKKEQELCRARTTDTQWRHESKKFENLGRCGRQNMLRPCLKIWYWDWIFGHAVKTISPLGVRSPCNKLSAFLI